MMSGMTVMNCSHVPWPSGGDVGNFIIQSFPSFFLTPILFGRKEQKRIIPGDFNLYKIRFELVGCHGFLLPLLKFWQKQLVTFDTKTMYNNWNLRQHLLETSNRDSEKFQGAQALSENHRGKRSSVTNHFDVRLLDAERVTTGTGGGQGESKELAGSYPSTSASQCPKVSFSFLNFNKPLPSKCCIWYVISAFVVRVRSLCSSVHAQGWVCISIWPEPESHSSGGFKKHKKRNVGFFCCYSICSFI